jgi:hypothetical protein
MMDSIVLDLSLITFLGLVISWLFLPSAAPSSATVEHAAATA